MRAAINVCGRAGRGKRRDEASAFREQQRRLKLAERLLSDIGFVDPDDSSEMTIEARALCSWLEGRERQAGIKRPSRRGQEYQDRLRRVEGFLTAAQSPEDEVEKPEQPLIPPELAEELSVYKPTGVATDG